MLRLTLWFLAASLVWGQPQKPRPSQTTPGGTLVEQPDAQRTREELRNLLQRYPPTLKTVLSIDPSLLSNEAFLAPYPALASFVNNHSEIVRSPQFYVGEYENTFRRENSTPGERVWQTAVDRMAAIAGFGMGIGLLIWLIRTLIDYRRWNRLAKTQTDVHTKILDRFTANDDLLEYIKSPAGAKFLESSPITLDTGPRTIGAPLGRILWSVQAGLVLVAGGIGLEVVSARIAYEAAQPIHVLGVLAVALGIGFVISAIMSFMISRRLGLIDTPPPARRETSGIQG